MVLIVSLTIFSIVFLFRFLFDDPNRFFEFQLQDSSTGYKWYLWLWISRRINLYFNNAFSCLELHEVFGSINRHCSIPGLFFIFFKILSWLMVSSQANSFHIGYNLQVCLSFSLLINFFNCSLHNLCDILLKWAPRVCRNSTCVIPGFSLITCNSSSWVIFYPHDIWILLWSKRWRFRWRLITIGWRLGYSVTKKSLSVTLWRLKPPG